MCRGRGGDCVEIEREPGGRHPVDGASAGRRQLCVQPVRRLRDHDGRARVDEDLGDGGDQGLGAVGGDDAGRRHVDPVRHGRPEVVEGSLRVERRPGHLGGGRVQDVLGRAEQVLVPVQRDEVGQAEPLLEFVAGLARVVWLDAGQRRPGQARPVRPSSRRHQLSRPRASPPSTRSVVPLM